MMSMQPQSIVVEQTDPPRPPADTLPTMYDLPSENPEEPGVPDQYHPWQAELLTQTFLPPDCPREEMLIASDLNLYYDVHHTNYYKRPDWYVVLDVPHLYAKREPRLSYVIWQEGAAPFIVIELLSPGTGKEDLGMTLRKSDKPPTKWEVYEQILGIPYYVVFNRYTDELRAFELVRRKYREVALPENSLPIPELKLSLKLWTGEYMGMERKWLRWYDAANKRIPTLAERVDMEKFRAQQAEAKAEKLAAKLRSLGINPQTLNGV